MARLMWITGFVVLGFVSGGIGEDNNGKDNTPPSGFKALFNGKNLDGWQGLIELPKRAKLSENELAAAQEKANARVLPHWTVKDGVLHYDGKSNSLQTAKDYGNFELYIDWKIAKKGDSGLYLRGNP